LLARGLREEDAIFLIVQGFLGAVLERMPIEGVRDELAELINGKLGV